MAFKKERANEIIKHELSMLISNELKNPRLANKIISITKVNTSPDMKYTKVSVSVFGDASSQKEVMDTLEKAKGFLRKGIAQALTTKFAPEIVFELDNTLEYAARIDKVIKEINDGGK
ncbi:MAG: 30S ribosome-binding factor RbfA [Eubacteriaceae bacterium]|nr:30S ribosome-binding factor RbfA [Eubacteriaceae bacterium]